jgi:hypothetical protein
LSEEVSCDIWGGVSHPQATEIGLAMCNDMLCPSCASVFTTSGVLPSILSSDNYSGSAVSKTRNEISVAKKRSEISHDDAANADHSSAVDRKHHKKHRKKHVPGSTAAHLKKDTSPETLKEIDDVTNSGTTNGTVTTPVAYKKREMNKLFDESWGYDFSANVPIDFPIVTGIVANGKSKVIPIASPSAALQPTVTAADAVKHCCSMLHRHIVDVNSPSNLAIEDVVIGGETIQVSGSLDNLAINPIVNIGENGVPEVQSPSVAVDE